MATSFIKDLISILSSRGAVIVLNIAANIITARFLGPEGNGTIAGLIVYPSMFLTIGSLGIRQATTYFAGNSKYEISRIFSSVLAIWIFTSILCTISCYFLIKYFSGGDYSVTLILLAIAPIPFSLFSTYSSGIFLGMQNIREFNRINWIPALFILAFTFLLVIVLQWSVEGAMAASFLGSFVFFFFVVDKVKQFASIKIAFDFIIIKEMLSLGIVYAISLLMTALNYKICIILLEKLSSPHELGIYSKGASLVEYLWIIPTLISTLIFSRSAGAKDPVEFSLKACRLLRFTGAAIFLASGLLFVFSDTVIYILFGPSFSASTSILRIMLPGVFLLTIFKVLNMDLAGKGKPWLSMIAMIPAVIVNFILNLLWIPKYGSNGSAIASTLSYSLAALIYLVVYSKQTSIPILKILTFTKEDKELIQSSVRKLRSKILSKISLSNVD